MRKHKLYFTDDQGCFDGYDRQTVYIDQTEGILHIGRRLKIPLRHIRAAEVRPQRHNPKGKFLAIDICSPSIENGEPTTIALIHKDFFARTKVAPMQTLADEITPFIDDTVPVEPSGLPERDETRENHLRAQYVLNISVLVGLYRKLWYSYDRPHTIVVKTLLLMLLAGVVNLFGVLLVVVPFDNFKMSRNLVAAGWSKWAALVAYLVLSFPAYVWWLTVVVGLAWKSG